MVDPEVIRFVVNQLRQARLARGLSQVQLARMLGTRQSSVSEVETGRHLPGLDLLCRWTAALQVDLIIPGGKHPQADLPARAISGNVGGVSRQPNPRKAAPLSRSDPTTNAYDQVIREIRRTGKFTVKPEHLRLLRHAYVDWWEMEFGAPCIDPKRPYGNSAVLRDIADIATPGWDAGKDEDAADAYLERLAVEDLLIRLHAETAVALQIALATGSFTPGEYTLTERYDDTSWTPAALDREN